MTLMSEAGTGRSECWVFRASEIEAGPIARVSIPTRVPTGFHAKWIPGDRVWNSCGSVASE